MPNIDSISHYANKQNVVSQASLKELKIDELEYIYETLEELALVDEHITFDIAFFFDLLVDYYVMYYQTEINTGLALSSRQNLNMIVYLYSGKLYCDYYNTQEREAYIDQFSHHGEILLMLFACGRFDAVEHIYPKFKAGLEQDKIKKSMSWVTIPKTGEVIPPTPQKLGVLAVEMMSYEHNEAIDWAAFDIPVDPLYSNLARLHLLDKDETQVADWLHALCESHLKWTSLFLNDSEESAITGFEIEEELLMLWPFEYQAIKHFRARHGLTTPTIQHPLLSTKMAIDHRPDFSQWERPDWYETIMSKLETANPELRFLRSLFED